MNIYPLNKIPKDVLNQVGGKARGLKLLIDNRLRVPEGFVVTQMRGEADLNVAVEYYAKSGLKRVAVRSSALTEDTIDFSSAGLYASFLNLEGVAAVKKSMRDCVFSLINRNAQSYTRFFSPTKPACMCVIVQAMVEAEMSGVCFTEAPDDSDIIAIDAVAGLGDALMGGVAAPHSYRVKKTDDHPKGDALIDDDLLARIVKEAHHASVELGYPLDLEWAVSSGELYWLQAKPITTTTLQDPGEFDSKPLSANHVYSPYRIKDFLPGAVTPLTLSTVIKALDTGIRHAMVKQGAVKKLSACPENSGVASFYNHLFFNVTEMSKLSAGLANGAKKVIETSLCGQTVDGAMPKGWDLPIADFVNTIRRMFSGVDISKNTYKELKALADSFKVDLWGKSLKWQIEEIDHKVNVLETAFLDYYKTFSTSADINAGLYLIFLKNGMSAEQASTFLTECLSNIDDIESADILYALKTVTRELVLDNPKIANASIEGIEEALLNASGESKKALDSFYARHGHRGMLEMDLRSRSWQMSSHDLAMYVHSNIKSDLSVPKRQTKSSAYLRAIDSQFESSVQAPLKQLVEQARLALFASQLTRSMCVRVVSQFRAAYHFLGQKMAERKLIPDADLVFFMTHSELLDFISNNDFEFVKKIVYNPELIKKAFARKRVYEAQKLLKFDNLCVGKPEPIADAIAPGETVLTGTVSCPGKVEAKARVIHDLGDLIRFEPGEVMVTAFTDVGWIPYYGLAAGLITETGSVMSHGAVVAREFSLPHITNIAHATRRIRTGDTLLLNANDGEVKILP